MYTDLETDEKTERELEREKASPSSPDHAHLFFSLGLFPQPPTSLPSESLEQGISTPSLLSWHGKHHLKACTVPGNLHKLNSP